MRETLLDILTCPVDHGALRLADGGDGDSADRVTATLLCDSGHEYAVRDRVPRLVPGEAAVDVAAQDDTVTTFSSKWSRVSPEEIEQRYRQQYQWYVERFGFGDEAGLAEFLATKEAVLEVGTGTGGDAARFARLSDAEVIGVDLSSAIDVAQKEFGGPENLHYAQGDILRLPFDGERFDFISADQVLHHTPGAPRAFGALARLLRPGGHLAVYVYKIKAPLRELADDWIRERATQMSVDDCMELSADIAELGRELSRTGARITLERGVPLLGIEPGEHDVQRLIYWHFLKCFWSDDFSDQLNTLVGFDWYHPPFASRHTEQEVRGWCAAAGLDVAHMDVGDSGISVLAQRPS